MARDDLAPLAVGEAALELGVELTQAVLEVGGCTGPAQDVADLSGHRRIADRIEPDVGVEFPAGAEELDASEEIDDLAVGAVGRVLERGLELGAEEEDDVGGADPLDVANGEL